MRTLIALTLALVLWTIPANAGHPLITDDTGTQRRGKFQVEINGEYSYDEETADGVKMEENAVELSTSMSYGLSESADLVVGVPHQWVSAKEDDVETIDEDGISDVVVEFKWRFYEKDSLSFAIKPGISLPTRDEEKGLGNGRISYSVILIATKEAGRWAFHINGGYMRNEYSLDGDEAANRNDLWHLSVASEYSATDYLKLATNVGIERNPDRSSDTHPAFILGGLIYSISESVDVDFGVKAGLNRPEADIAFLAGVAHRF
jgi:hypothetical protein